MKNNHGTRFSLIATVVVLLDSAIIPRARQCFVGSWKRLERVKPNRRHECAGSAVRVVYLDDLWPVRDAMSATFPVSSPKYAACSGERYHGKQRQSAN